MIFHVFSEQYYYVVLNAYPIRVQRVVVGLTDLFPVYFPSSRKFQELITAYPLTCSPSSCKFHLSTVYPLTCSPSLNTFRTWDSINMLQLWDKTLVLKLQCNSNSNSRSHSEHVSVY